MRIGFKLFCLSVLLSAFATVGEDKDYIENRFFKQQKDGNAVRWTSRGNYEFQSEGADVVLKPDEKQNTQLVQFGIKPPIKVPLVLSWDAEGQGGPAKYRVYIERCVNINGKLTNHINYKSAFWRDASPGWKQERFEFLMPDPYAVCYVVLQLDKTSPHPARIRNLSLHISETAPRCLGGFWSVPDPHQIKDNILQLNGKKGVATLGPLAVKPGCCYRLTYTAQGIGESKTTTGYHTFRTSISPAVKGSFVSDDVMSGAQGKSHAFTIPKTDKTNQISVSFQLRDDGCIRFSNFAFAEVPIDPTAGWECQLEQPFYRGFFFGEQENAVISGTVTADESAKTLSIELHSEIAALKQMSVPFTKGKAPFTLTAGKLPFGRYLLDAQVRDDAGNSLKLFSPPLRVLPPATNMVTLLPNRYPAIGGRPFFPIMHCDFPEEQMRFSRANGVNLVRIHLGQDAKLLNRELDFIHSVGMKTFLILGAPRAMRDVKKFEEKIRRIMTKENLAHPALYGYLHIDEPLWGGVPPEPMVAVYEFMKEFDPYHPVWMNTAPRNSVPDLKPYAATCDLLGVDIYPIPYPNGHSGLEDKTPTACGKYAQRLQQIGGPSKSIFMWLQGFRWAECSSTDNPKQRYPTYPEFRFMVYDTLLNGGNGFAIWGCQYLNKFTLPNKGDYFEDVMLPVTQEANSLSSLFCEGKQLDDLKTSSDSVRCAVIQYAGDNYYFILNLKPEQQNASVAIAASTPLQALAASRADAFTQEATAIQVELAPYEVLILSSKPLPPSIAPCPRLPVGGDSHPYRTYFTNIYEHKFDGSSPCWIWDDRANVGRGKCWAFLDFDVQDAKAKTILYATIDDQGEVFFNGEKVADCKGWSELQTIDLTDRVRKGKNTIAIRGEDVGGLPCGILAKILCGKQTIYSDLKWRTLPAGTETVPPDHLNADTHKPLIIAPYGQGAWGKGVLFP
ncbi:MAG: hypothetical protein J6X55_08610 [Victivallales bacterium]|nr:hypothetical protein [Victivallales bacterium]